MSGANKYDMETTQYLIIGNSASGLAAAGAIRSEDKKGRITILTEEEQVNYSKPLITYYLAGKVDLEKTGFKDRDFYTSNNISLLTGTRVISIDVEGSHVVTGGGKKIKFGKLLIASGGKPVIPKIKMTGFSHKKRQGCSLMDSSNYSSIKGVFTLTTLEDAMKVRDYIEKNEIGSATILGGGLIGLKSAEAFLELGIKINIVELADRILAATFDSRASSIIENAIEARGSSIHKDNTIDEIFIRSGRISGYRLRDGIEKNCRLLIIAVGVNPDLSFIDKGLIRAGRGIKVDGRMQTSAPNIYASGDVIEGPDILLGQNRNIAIWPLAVGQGNVAGSNMAGREAHYQGGYFMNSVEILGIPSISMGMTNVDVDDGSSVEVKTEFRPERNQYKKIVIRDNRVIGIIMIGNIERAGIYSGLIKNRIDLSGMKENIFREDFGIIHLPSDYKKHLVVGEGIEV